MPPNQCSLSWFVKKPVYLSAFDSEIQHSGVAVIDIMFPTVSSFPFSQLSFKNNYTAFITIKVKCKDIPNVTNTKTQQTQNATSTGGNVNSHAQSGSSKTNQKWRTVLRNFALMPSPNSEEGSQKTFVITREMMSHFNKDVVQFRLIIRQPSPYWSNFDIENLHFEQESKNIFDHNSALTHSLVTTLREISEQNKETSSGKKMSKMPDKHASLLLEPNNHSNHEKNKNLEKTAERVGAILHNMWALTELYGKVKHDESIGRFEIDGSYEINLLSYN